MGNMGIPGVNNKGTLQNGAVLGEPLAALRGRRVAAVITGATIDPKSIQAHVSRCSHLWIVNAP